MRYKLDPRKKKLITKLWMMSGSMIFIWIHGKKLNQLSKFNHALILKRWGRVLSQEWLILLRFMATTSSFLVDMQVKATNIPLTTSSFFLLRVVLTTCFRNRWLLRIFGTLIRRNCRKKTIISRFLSTTLILSKFQSSPAQTVPPSLSNLKTHLAKPSLPLN